MFFLSYDWEETPPHDPPPHPSAKWFKNNTWHGFPFASHYKIRSECSLKCFFSFTEMSPYSRNVQICNLRDALAVLATLSWNTNCFASRVQSFMEKKQANMQFFKAFNQQMMTLQEVLCMTHISSATWHEHSQSSCSYWGGNSTHSLVHLSKLKANRVFISVVSSI